MIIKNCKVYNDGGHYIAIPPNERKHSRGRLRRKSEDRLTVVNKNSRIRVQENVSKSQNIGDVHDSKLPLNTPKIETERTTAEDLKNDAELQSLVPQEARCYSRSQVFDELYKNCVGMTKHERLKFLKDNLLPFFYDEKECEEFIKQQLDRKTRNKIIRRIGINRKVFMNEFNYFVTFTFSDALHTEETFRKQLKTLLSHNSNRKGWQHIGVWERGSNSERLHYHALMYIPEGTMSGELVEVKDYDTKAHKMQTTMQNTYFNKYFGRSDFKTLDFPGAREQAISYLVKYLDKTGERISCSKNLFKYIITDIDENDVICDYGVDGRKKILFPNFICIVNGEKIGTADNPETLAKMPRCN